jgi:uncharacterized protein
MQECPATVEYVAFAAWCFAVALLGGFVGLVLGNVRLPAVVALASPRPPARARTLASARSLPRAHRSGMSAQAELAAVAWMAPPSVAGAIVGGYISGVVPSDALLGAIAIVLFYSAFDLLRWKPRPAVEGSGEPRLDIRAAVLTGTAIGLLGGIVGLILGSLRMPALVRVGEALARAVGTNVTVGFCVGVAGVIGHLPSDPPDWGLLAVGAGASIPGALLGSRLTGRLSEKRLMQGIAFALLVAATTMTVEVLT